MAPSLGNGKICYIEIPAADIPSLSAFYATVFGWNLRNRDDGHLAFSDTVDQVSGTWVTGKPPASEHGLRVYIMVDDMEATMAAIVAHGGEIFEGVGAHFPEITARFRDPYGIIFSLYQEGGRQRNGQS
jgi:predicted enzyme related to lactoylglutathione lyase